MKRLLTLSLAGLFSMTNAQAIHPDITLLDRQGQPVHETKAPLSVSETCGDCHDAGFITENHDHARHIASNCLLCHSEDYGADAYFSTRQSKNAAWAASAGLEPINLVSKTLRGWQWNLPETDDGEEGQSSEFTAQQLGMKAAGSAVCEQCHGIVHNSNAPLVLDADAPIGRLTQKEGAIFSGQKLSRSGLNLAGKAELSRSFDVHAERLLECTDCHRAANNPVHGGMRGQRMSHLIHDPRLPDLSEFIERPDHNLVIGMSGFGIADGEGGCQGCHAPDDNHDWLPEVTKHFSALACQSCHIPELVGPAQQLLDRSVRDASGEPVVVWRGQDGADSANSNTSLITPYQPLLVPRPGDVKYAPYNVAMTRFWRDASTGLGVERELVDQAWKDSGLPAATTATVLNSGELEKLKRALWEQGVERPELAEVVTAYPVNHGVSRDNWALKSCDACHSEQSRLSASLPLGAAHGGAIPQTSTGALPLQLEIGPGNQLQVRNSTDRDFQLSWLDKLWYRFK